MENTELHGGLYPDRIVENSLKKSNELAIELQ
jgi:hypothetical protein